jgi:hypothetical protein
LNHLADCLIVSLARTFPEAMRLISCASCVPETQLRGLFLWGIGKSVSATALIRQD